MVAASVSATTMASKLCYSSKSDCRRAKPAKKSTSLTKLAIQNPLPFSSQNHNAKGFFSVRALGPQTQRDGDGKEDSSSATSNKNKTAFTAQEDLDYLWKLVVGSILGAAIIKYGSVVFPEITRPNLPQALLMILIPVVVAVLLLINQSRNEDPS